MKFLNRTQPYNQLQNVNGWLRGKKEGHTYQWTGWGRWWREEIHEGRGWGRPRSSHYPGLHCPHCRHFSLCRSHRKTRPCHLTELKEPGHGYKCMYIRFEYIAFSTDNYNLKYNIFNEKSSVHLYLNCQIWAQIHSIESSIPVIIIDNEVWKSVWLHWSSADNQCKSKINKPSLGTLLVPLSQFI